MTRLIPNLDENAVIRLGLAAHPEGFGLAHVMEGGKRVALETSPDLDGCIDGVPRGYASALSASLISHAEWQFAQAIEAACRARTAAMAGIADASITTRLGVDELAWPRIWTL